MSHRGDPWADRGAAPRALPDIDTAQIPTGRLGTCVRWIGERETCDPVVFLHGNVASSPFFFPLMQNLPRRFLPISVDLRGFGGTDPEPVDATRGLRDFSDDVLAALEALEIDRAHVIGWSLGGGVAMRVAIDAPERVKSMTLIAPISPYGFCGTVSPDGALLAPDGAGSGAGTVSRRFVAALADGDTGDGPSSPRTLLRRFYVGPDWDGDGEETYLAAMLSTAVGDDHYPGDRATSTNWPGTAPGTTGVMNAMAPTNMNLAALADIEPQPPILWLRGERDVVISDSSAMDIVQRGRTGAIPDYPGAEVAPPQPMLAQTHAVLDAYAAAGGRYREVVIPGVGHSPHIEDPPRVLESLVPHLDGATEE
jgi:pimeloyl-ACP methyl ester carboxylesterase